MVMIIGMMEKVLEGLAMLLIEELVFFGMECMTRPSYRVS